MSLEHILLGCLKSPASGYDLKAYFDQNVRAFWSAELSQIYPALKRMEQRGLLASHEEPSRKGPARRVYTRTAAGREALLRWLTSEPQVGTERFAYLAQVFFMAEVDDLAATRAFLADLRGRMASWTGRLKQIEQEVLAQAGKPPEEFSADGLHRFLALRMGIHSVGSKVAWCDEAIAVLDRKLSGTRSSKEHTS